MADPFDLIKNASEGNPSDFISTFHDLIGQKVMDALDQRKQEVALTMFSPQEVESDHETEDDTDLQSVEDSSTED